MSKNWRYKTVRYIRIILCILSVLLITMVEDSEFTTQVSREGGASLYVYMALALLAVSFLQNQLYNYMVPRDLRASALHGINGHYEKSFFKGCIGAGYCLVVSHLIFTFNNSANLDHFASYMYIGIALISLGTLSKIKGIIANELLQLRNAYKASSGE